MNRILFVANIPEHLEGFHYPYMKWFQEIGWEVHAVTAKGKNLEYCDSQKFISVERTPFHFSNIKAYFQIKKIIETEKYDLIHCNTATPSILAILAARKSRKIYKTKVINTIHGFWFFKGAPITKWLFYPISKFCAKHTDCLITINKEDYKFAKEKMNPGEVFKVNGVGFKNKFIEKKQLTKAEKILYREKFGVKDENRIVLLSVGELSSRKNHMLVLKALAELKTKNFVYFIAGEGALQNELETFIRLNKFENNVFLLGFRNDIEELMRAADIFVFPSKQEGLPVSLMEAMASSLPCVASNIRGNNDLIDENGGILFESNNLEQLKDALAEIMGNSDKQRKMGEYNRVRCKDYSLENVLPEMKKIYMKFFNE